MSEPQSAFNAADHKQVTERARKDRQSNKQYSEDMKAALEHPEVRRIFWRFMGECGIEKSPFNPNAAIANHAIGMRDAAQMLKAWILEADERAYLAMMQENFRP